MNLVHGHKNTKTKKAFWFQSGMDVDKFEAKHMISLIKKVTNKLYRLVYIYTLQNWYNH